jgi:Protein of unknown function (DUF669)
MSIQDFSAPDLAEFDGLYEAAEIAPAATPADVPDGEYQVVIDQVDLTQARTSGNKMMVWKFRVREGVHAGRCLWKWRAIAERTIPYLKEELVKCGLKLERLSDLPKHMDQLPGKDVRIVKRTKDTDVNIYIQWSGPRLVDSDEDLPF